MGVPHAAPGRSPALRTPEVDDWDPMAQLLGDAYRELVPVLRSIALVWMATLLRVAMAVTTGSILASLLHRQGPGAWQVGILLASPLLLAAVEYVSVVHDGARQATWESHLRRQVVRTTWNRGLEHASSRRSGGVVSLATDSVERSAAMRTTFTGPMIGQMSAPIVVLVAVGFTVGIRQALILAIALPLVPLFVRAFQKAFASVSGRHRKASAELATQFLEALQGLTDLRLLGAGARFGVRLARKSKELRRRVMAMLLANQVVILVADAGFSVGMLVMSVWLALSGLASGALAAGQALTLVLLAPLLMEPLNHIGKFFYVGMGGRAATKALRSFVSGDDGASATAAGARLGGPMEDVDRGSEGVPASGGERSGSAGVELRAVDFGWEEGQQVLHRVNLRVGSGEHLALIGPSGGGKSTILALIAGTMEPNEGAILFGGAALDAAQRRRQCSIVRQSAFLFTGTLAENLLLARPEASIEELWKALDDANLGEARAWPRGLETPIGERGLEISGGQAQRIAIARAFLRDAPILLLDEPTSQVDLTSERAIRDALMRLGMGRTVVTVAHRRALVDAADRVLEVRQGEVIA